MLIFSCLITIFIVFYVVIGTLSHAKIILELLLQNDKAKAFSEVGDPPLNSPPPEGETPCPPPLTHIKNEGEELIRKGKEYFLTRKVNPSETKSKFN